MSADHRESFLEDLRADLARYFAFNPDMSLREKLKIALISDGIWASGVYRLGRALSGRRRGPVGRIAWAGYRALELLVRRSSGIHLDVESQIGPGFFIGHFASIYVGPGVRIGAQSSIGQMCFVGAGGIEAAPGAPTLGDRVYLGVGAKVLGGVRVGDDAAVGANAVVLQDVPPNSVVAGNPARVVSFRGSEDFLGLKPSAAAVAAKAAKPGVRNVVKNRLRGTPPVFSSGEGAAPEAPIAPAAPRPDEPAR